MVLDGKGVSENRVGRGRIAVFASSEMAEPAVSPKSMACAREKRSTPCGTRSACTMGVLKQKVIVEIPAKMRKASKGALSPGI
jgi:hypothetical protein